jgi:hypothetical protein
VVSSKKDNITLIESKWGKKYAFAGIIVYPNARLVELYFLRFFTTIDNKHFTTLGHFQLGVVIFPAVG